MYVQLNIIALAKRFSHRFVPLIRERFQIAVLILILPESELLHYFGIERAADAETIVDTDKTSHRLKLQPANVARAVATQFPIIDQGKVYCRHRCWSRIITPRTDYVVLPYDRDMKTALTILILLALAAPGTQTRSFKRVVLL